MLPLLLRYDDLWGTAHKWISAEEQWCRGSFEALDAEVISDETNAMWRGAFKMSKSLKDKKLTGPARSAEKLKNEITVFRDRLPVVQVLCNKGMQARHWERISEVSGYAVMPDKNTTLEQLLALKLEKHMDKIEEIGVAASKEYSLEKALRAMKTEWGEMEFSFSPCKCHVPVTTKDSFSHVIAADTRSRLRRLYFVWHRRSAAFTG